MKPQTIYSFLTWGIVIATIIGCYCIPAGLFGLAMVSLIYIFFSFLMFALLSEVLYHDKKE